MKINAGNIPKLLFLEKSLLCLDPPGILFCLEFSESLREYILNFLLFTLYQKSSPKKWYSGKITHSFTSFVCGGNSQEIHPLRSYYLDAILLDGEGNGTPLQYSCLENPVDGGAWWAAIHGVAKSQTRLKQLSSSSSSSSEWFKKFQNCRSKSQWQRTNLLLPRSWPWVRVPFFCVDLRAVNPRHCFPVT